MALINVGIIDNFPVTANEAAKKREPSLANISSFSSLQKIPDDAASENFDLITSDEPRGIGLQRIQLVKGFEGYLQQFLNPTNEIYFIAWAWDLSGQPLYFYPGPGKGNQNLIIPIKVGMAREFIGQGINLFPKRKVKGGIALRVQLWESDQQIRNVGKTISATAREIKKSRLNHLLSVVSTATGLTGTTITLIKEAAVELSGLIGKILQKNGDDYVDLFEGYYASDRNWHTGKENYMGYSSQITFDKY